MENQNNLNSDDIWTVTMIILSIFLGDSMTESSSFDEKLKRYAELAENVESQELKDKKLSR